MNFRNILESSYFTLKEMVCYSQRMLLSLKNVNQVEKL